MSAAAIVVAEGVWRIPTAPFDLVNTFAFVDDDGSVTLVDCGLARADARIVAGLDQLGKAPSDVRRIVLTHAHSDHAGATAALSRRTGAPVEIHAADAEDARQGRRPPGDPSSTAGRLVERVLKGGFEPVAVARMLQDGDVLPVAGRLHVVHTPGHTPGHLSLLHERSEVLITGDAIFNVLRLRWPVSMFCSDVALTRTSAQRLADLDYSVAAFTHGPHLTENARERVRSFLAAASR